MQRDGLDHGGRQQRPQEGQHLVLVQVVDVPGQVVVALAGQQMAEVVQQAGGDRRVVVAGLLRQPGGLQRMLQLADGLAAVERLAALLEQGLDVADAECHPASRSGLGAEGHHFFSDLPS